MESSALDGKLNGHDLFGEPIKREAVAPIADRFLIPPFTILSARDGIWQDRKRAWLSLGIKSEVGRGDNLLMESEQVTSPGPNYYRDQKKLTGKAAQGGYHMPAMDYSNRERGTGRGNPIAGTSANGKSKFGKCNPEGFGEKYGREEMNGTSIFDPVLCEIAYRWFAPEGGQVVDPFCGGSVRGIVAALMGRQYWGCDLRAEQIAANEQQYKDINPHIKPTWVQGDAIDCVPQAPEADLIFSCPPYYDLEVYSDDPKDLSQMEWEPFCETYAQIIKHACDRLRNNRFAVWVVGDVRGPDGNYRDFVGETIKCFRAAGLGLYNYAILVTAVGSLPIRITKQFEAGRKLGKSHQDVLIFVKGDGKKAAEAVKGGATVVTEDAEKEEAAHPPHEHHAPTEPSKDYSGWKPSVLS